MRFLASLAALLLALPAMASVDIDWPDQWVQIGTVIFLSESWPAKPMASQDIAGFYENDFEGATEWNDSSGLWGLSCAETGSNASGNATPALAGAQSAYTPGDTFNTVQQANCTTEFSNITTGTVVSDFLFQVSLSSSTTASSAFRFLTTSAVNAFPAMKVDPDGAGGALGVLASCSTSDSGTVIAISVSTTYKMRMVYVIETDVNTLTVDGSSGTWGAGAVGTSSCDGAGIAQILNGVQYRGGVTFDSLFDNVGACTSIPTLPGRCGIF